MEIFDVTMSFLALVILEVILGIDNLIFLSILTAKLPQKHRKQAQQLGLLFAWLSRLGLLIFALWLIRLNRPILNFGELNFSMRDLFLICGGCFLMMKATQEIHRELDVKLEVKQSQDEVNQDSAYVHGIAGFRSVVMQIACMDIIFSMDSILTAVGLTSNYWVMGLAMTLAMLVGIPAGLWAAAQRDRWPDYLSRVVALGAISMPRFFLGLVLQLVFAMAMGWLPLGGRFPITEDLPLRVTGFLTLDALIAGDGHAFKVACQHLLMPALAMSLSPLATLMRMMRASTLEVLQQDYVLTERALGLPQRLILLKYVARNAVSSTLTVTGLYFGWLLGGTVLVETIFDWPGLGLYATKAVVTQDFMPIIGVTLVIGTLFVAANLVIDLLYGVINPKVRQP